MSGFTSGFTLEVFVEDAVSGDEANDEASIGEDANDDDVASVGRRYPNVALATSAEKRRGKRGFEIKISNIFESSRRQGPPRAAKLDRVAESRGQAGLLADELPCKKARGGGATFVFRLDRTKADAAAKGGREAEAHEEEADDSDAADDDNASVGRRRPTKAPPMTIVGRDADYDTVVSGGRLRSTVATMEEANELNPTTTTRLKASGLPRPSSGRTPTTTMSRALGTAAPTPP